jgi:hypothetical protein
MGQLPHDHALARPLVEPVLWRRDEVCVTHGGGVLVALTLTAIRSAWLVEHERVVNAFVASSGRPAPLLAIHRLDKRFPLDVGFDENLPELARTLGRLRGAFSAIAVVLEFDGIMAAAFGVSLDVVTLLAGGRLPPIARHPTPGRRCAGSSTSEASRASSPPRRWSRCSAPARRSARPRRPPASRAELSAQPE